MITAEKLSIYRRFNGDLDGWSRSGCPDADKITESEWREIASLVTEAAWVKNRLVDSVGCEKIAEQIRSATENEFTAESIFALAR